MALAAALQADVCEIYTDVDGVYTADPNIVPEARKLDRISYDEMLEMASLGAKVLQSRSVEFARSSGAGARPVHVSSGPGHARHEGGPAHGSVVVAGVAHDRDQAKVTIRGVPDRPGIAAQVFRASRRPRDRRGHDRPERGAPDGLTDISFTVPRGRTVVPDFEGEVGEEDRRRERDLRRPDRQGLHRRGGDAQPLGGCGPDVPGPLPGGVNIP